MEESWATAYEGTHTCAADSSVFDLGAYMYVTTCTQQEMEECKKHINAELELLRKAKEAAEEVI